MLLAHDPDASAAEGQGSAVCLGDAFDDREAKAGSELAGRSPSAPRTLRLPSVRVKRPRPVPCDVIPARPLGVGTAGDYSKPPRCSTVAGRRAPYHQNVLGRPDNLVLIREGDVGLAPGLNTLTAQAGGPAKFQSAAGPNGVANRVRRSILDRSGAPWMLR